MNALYQLFENSGDAVFGIDRFGTIRFWNDACQQLLGLKKDQVIGEKCAKLLQGVDLQGKQVCGAQCPVDNNMPSCQCTTDFDLVVKGTEGTPVWLNVGAYCVPTNWQENTAHVHMFLSLRKVNSHQLIQRLVSESRHQTISKKPASLLTTREKEILRMAIEGNCTANIAEQLNISPATVRNHFKNIYSKIDVHSRAEAVSVALNSSLI